MLYFSLVDSLTPMTYDTITNFTLSSIKSSYVQCSHLIYCDIINVLYDSICCLDITSDVMNWPVYYGYMCVTESPLDVSCVNKYNQTGHYHRLVLCGHYILVQSLPNSETCTGYLDRWGICFGGLSQILPVQVKTDVFSLSFFFSKKL